MPSAKHPEGDYAAQNPDQSQQLDIMSELPAETPSATEDSSPTPEAAPPMQRFGIPENIRPRVEADEAEANARFDRIDAQGQTTNFGTRERAKTPAPEDEEVFAARAARKLLAGRKKQSKPTRRGLGSRQLLTADGPPAHVSREIREGYPPEDTDPPSA